MTGWRYSVVQSGLLPEEFLSREPDYDTYIAFFEKGHDHQVMKTW